MKALLDQREKMEAERKELEKQFPGCNSKWNKEDGGTLFCSEKRYIYMLSLCIYEVSMYNQVSESWLK